MSLSNEMRDKAAQCLEGMGPRDIRILCECCIDHLNDPDEMQHFIDYVLLSRKMTPKGGWKWDGYKHEALGRIG